MKNILSKNKKILIIVGVVLIVLLGLVLALVFQSRRVKQTKNNGIIDMNNNSNVEITKDNRKNNVSEKIKESRDLDGIEIKDIELYATADISYFKANVTNTKSSNFTGGIAIVTFKNKDGEELDSLEVYIPALDANQSNAINASTTKDIANAYDLDIKLS